MAAHTQDDGFHEIQLNGKQLVFLFMAATVVSVVIFLCGVLVGRGVRAERGDVAQTEAPSGDVAPTVSQDVARTPAPPASEIAATPPQPVDELSYFNRLEKPNPSVETLAKPKPEPAAPAAKPAAPDAAAKVKQEPPKPEPVRPEPRPAEPRVAESKSAEPKTSEPKAAEPKAAESKTADSKTTESKTAAAAAAPSGTKEAPTSTEAPSTNGFAVQVAALNVRSEADAMAKRLNSKGYSAYVLAAANGTPSVFRVRIGSYKTRREAEAMAARLQKEEQIKPWVTR